MVVPAGLVPPLAERRRLGRPLPAPALLLRRPPVPAMPFLGLRGSLDGPDGAHVGWSGPIGIAAASCAVDAPGPVHDPLLWHGARAAIVACLLIHGPTAALTRFQTRRRSAPPPRNSPLEDAGERTGAPSRARIP